MTEVFDYPKHVQFNCKRCSQCCGDTEDTVRHVLLLKSEAERISNNTSLYIEEFSHKILGSEPYVYEMEKTATGKCFFLKDNTCTIYGIRPLICRFYPFELRNLGNNRYSFAFTNKCQGIGNGPELEQEFFEKLFDTCLKAMEETPEE